VEPAGNQIRHPGQGPPLIDVEPVCRRTFVEGPGGPAKPGLVETTPAATGPAGTKAMSYDRLVDKEAAVEVDQGVVRENRLTVTAPPRAAVA
jgi:hypothetical protein